MTQEEAARAAAGDRTAGLVILEKLRESGMSDAEIRSQLRSFGFPSRVLDGYLGANPSAPTPSADILDAMRTLGLTGFSYQDSLLVTGDTAGFRVLSDSLRADSLRMADSLLTRIDVFGLNVFRQISTRFQPIVTGPVSGSYQLGPGDELFLILTGDVELAYNLPVTPNGFVVIPDVGRLSVNGLTMEQLETLLQTRLAQSYSGLRTGTVRFDVTVSRIRALSIRVLGEVAFPGTYEIAATSSVAAPLYQAGGPTRRGSFRRVEVRRGAALIAHVDLYDILLRGTIPDVNLQSGDIIFIPIGGPQVTLAGEVRRPAVYELAPGESLRELILAAGGPSAMAHTDNITISRIVPPEDRVASGRTRTVLTANLQSALQPTAAPIPLYDGDSVTVMPISGPTGNRVTIAGSVWQPGAYQLTDGMRFWDLVQAAGGLQPQVYRGRSEVRRMRADSTFYLFGVALPDDGAGPPNDNPLLMEHDSVSVYSLASFRPSRIVSVFGAVTTPSNIEFSDSLTLRDAILQAGGLQDDAYLLRAEVSRMRSPPSGDGDSLAVVIGVALDSSYVVDATSQISRPAASPGQGEFLLAPYDQVFVRRQPGVEPPRRVTISGEVSFPGTYALLSKSERLADIIGRSGGLTRQAYANGIRFFRRESGAGRVSVDLAEVLSNPNHRDNLALVQGDSIHIPAYIPTVRVEGAVLSPATSVTFVAGEDTDYYITAAGGFAEDADKGRTFVQQPNGLIQDRQQDPEPGATVLVPVKAPGERLNYVAILGTLVSLMASTATLIVALTR